MKPYILFIHLFCWRKAEFFLLHSPALEWNGALQCSILLSAPIIARGRNQFFPFPLSVLLSSTLLASTTLEEDRLGGGPGGGADSASAEAGTSRRRRRRRRRWRRGKRRGGPKLPTLSQENTEVEDLEGFSPPHMIEPSEVAGRINYRSTLRQFFCVNFTFFS